MAAEGDNVDASLLSETHGDLEADERGHGHFFNRKNFGKPTYCHHCCELIWGILSQGYVCEVCNFTCHEKCIKTVASFCSGVAMQLIKNPVAHSWSEPAYLKRKFCCVCRRRTDDQYSVECHVCEYYVHVDCLDLAVSDCKEAATYVPSLEPDVQVQHHHFREGNLPPNCKCAVCKKTCWSSECLAGMRCEWCGTTAHAICYKQIPSECTFGCLQSIMLPPNCLTIPRTELPMEQLLNIHPKKREHESSMSMFSDESMKDKDDIEYVRFYDGNTSLQRNTFKTAAVSRTASTQQIKEIALRTFHVQDSSSNYYLAQLPGDDGVESPLEDPFPLRSLIRKDEKRLQLVLRITELSPDFTVKVYGGWLRIPVTFCQVTATNDMTVETTIKESLSRFGLSSSSFNLYNLVEVSLDRGVVEKTYEYDEKLLTIIQDIKNDSLRKWQCSRFYLQEKDDPHGATVAVFVGNLPLSLSQKKYEMILLNLLGANEKPFTRIGPIFYEYGSLVITFNTPKSATKACYKLQNSKYEDNNLIVLCLPNIQPHMLPPGVEPLVVLVNVKSGGCQGSELIRSFRKLLNPFQVFDVLNGGPLVSLFVFRFIPKYKILICGGDGTVGWVLQCLDIVGQDSVCSSPPCGVVPLGTGNDLSRVLRWGSGYTGQEDPLQILKDCTEAEEVSLDRWTVVFHCEERSADIPGGCDLISEQGPLEDQTSMIIMNNYFGIGIDAEVCLGFHKAREEKPEKFQSRIHNKMFYGRVGIRKMINNACKDLDKKIRLEVDGKQIDLPTIEGIIVLNIMSWGSGAKPWGRDDDAEDLRFSKPNHYDGQLEVVGVRGSFHLGQIQSGVSGGIRIAQGGHIRIDTQQELPVQVDGEPKVQPPGRITILKSALKAAMLKKSKAKKSNVPHHKAGDRSTDNPPAASSKCHIAPHSSSTHHPHQHSVSAAAPPTNPHPSHPLAAQTVSSPTIDVMEGDEFL